MALHYKHYTLSQLLSAPLAEVIEDDSDVESSTTTHSADSSEDGYRPRTTTSHLGPDEISFTPVALLTMRLRSRKS